MHTTSCGIVDFGARARAWVIANIYFPSCWWKSLSLASLSFLKCFAWICGSFSAWSNQFSSTDFRLSFSSFLTFLLSAGLQYFKAILFMMFLLMPRPSEEADQLDALLRTNPGKWHLSIHLLHESYFVAHDAQRITLIHKKISQHLSNRSGFGASGIGIGWFAQREVVFLTFLDLSSDVWDIWKAMPAPSKKKVLASCQGCFTDSRHQQTSIQTYFWHVAFFFGPIAILLCWKHRWKKTNVSPSPGIQSCKTRAEGLFWGWFSHQNQSQNWENWTNSPIFFPWFWPWFFTFKKKKPLIFEN